MRPPARHLELLCTFEETEAGIYSPTSINSDVESTAWGEQCPRFSRMYKLFVCWCGRVAQLHTSRPSRDSCISTIDDELRLDVLVVANVEGGLMRD